MIIKIISCLYRSIIRTIEHHGIEHAGYMSFMIILSIFPFLIFLLTFTNFLGASKLITNVILILLKYLPQNTTELIQSRMHELIHTPPLSLAILGNIWTASSFIECLRTILNRANNIQSPPTYLKRRMISIIQLFIISIMIILTILLILPLVIILTKLINNYYIIPINNNLIIKIFRIKFIFIILFIMSSFLYYIIPNTNMKYANTIPGSILTVILWIITGIALSKYIIYYKPLNTIYGSLGSIIATLLFFYMINMIFIFGAEFNYSLKYNE